MKTTKYDELLKNVKLLAQAQKKLSELSAKESALSLDDKKSKRYALRNSNVFWPLLKTINVLSFCSTITTRTKKPFRVYWANMCQIRNSISRGTMPRSCRKKCDKWKKFDKWKRIL